MGKQIKSEYKLKSQLLRSSRVCYLLSYNPAEIFSFQDYVRLTSTELIFHSAGPINYFHSEEITLKENNQFTAEHRFLSYVTHEA